MILSFDKISKNDAGKAGGKGASLGEMTQAGIAIPPGFVVLAETFEEFVDSNNLRAEIQTILGELDHNNVGSIEHASEKIQELIRSGLISEKIQKEIQKYTKTIKTDFVAVRSSATAEDGAEHAWAGQLDTFLNVPKTDIITKIQSCWASLFTPRALFYRSEKGLGDIHISVAVVVQSMVDAESAGVAFSVHPVTENTDEIVIEGSWGLGEAVVSGEVTPDSFVISKSSGEIISEHIAEKKKGIFRNMHGENEWREIENRVQEKPILTKKELGELSQLIITIENHYGFPCDIEWAHAEGKIYILQARPITTLKGKINSIKKDWVNIWSGSWSFLSCTDFASALSHEVKILGEAPFNNVRIFINNGKSACWVPQDEKDTLGKKIADFYGNKKELEKVCASFKASVDDFMSFFETIKHKKIENKNYRKMWDLIVSEYRLHIIIKYIVDYLEPKLLNKFLPMLAEARVYAEPVFEKSEELMNNWIGEVAQKSKIESRYISCCTREEFQSAIKNNKYPDVGILAQRYVRSVIENDGKSQKIHTGNEAENIHSGLTDVAEDGSIRGSCAYPGKVQGIVRIIHDPTADNIFHQGDILVTGMTRPEYINLAKKSAGIITDAGGILSHAAITARELKIPCIIGTKNATQILKDGDLVEVDAENGIVKIIERKENFLENKKLEVWIERKQSIFSMTVFHELESKIMSEHLGGGFKTQICFMKNEVCSYIHEIGDLEKVIDNIARDLQTSSDKEREKFTIEMNQWEKIGKKIIKDGPEVVLQSEEAMREYLENYKNIGYWTTVVPYFLLEAIHTLQEQKRYTRLQKICERLRSNSLYPILNENITIKVLNHISLKAGLTQADAYYITWHETIQGLNGEIPKNIENIQQRKNKHNAFYRGKNGEIVFLENEKDIQILADLACGKDSSELIQGKKCHPGKVTGRVRILRTREDMKEFQEGDILVSPNSNPSLMPCIKKCSAIITDEGGVSCHAAIISRELKIPCIIGTKNATKILKDGDLVEVDAENGIVRKINTYIQGSNITNKTKLFSMRDRPQLLCPVYWNGVVQSGEITKKIYGEVLSEIFMIFADGRQKLFFIEDEWNSLADKISNKIIEDADFFDKLKKQEIGCRKKIESFLTQKNIKDSQQYREEIQQLFIEYDSIVTYAWFLAGDTLKKKIIDILNIEGEEADIILLPDEPTYVARMEKDIASASAEKNKNKAKELSEKYYWLPFGYNGPEIWGEEYFMQKINEISFDEAKRKIREIQAGEKKMQAKKYNIYKKYNFDNERMRLIEIMKNTTEWTDTRKMLDFQLFYKYYKSLEIFARKQKIPLHILQEFFTEDLKKINTGKIEEARQRVQGNYTVHYREGRYRILGKEDHNKLQTIVKEEISKNIEGQVACTGGKKKIQSHIKICKTAKEASEIEEGYILVASMTTPDYAVGMGRASGFITDEGGVTCHAAIVAREMQKPCIIGTKNATQILKDGDLVEMNTENGVVNILSRDQSCLEGKQFLSEGGRACYLYPNRIFCTRMTIPHPLWENHLMVISTSENHKVNWYFAVQDESEFDYTLERVLTKKGMLQKGEKEINKLVQKAKKTLKKEYKNAQDAWNGYENFIKIYEEIAIVPTFMRQLDRAVVRSLREGTLSEEDFATATYPTKRTYQRQEEVLLLELRTKFDNKITTEIEKKLDEIYKQYYTASLGYFEETVKTKKNYREILLGFSNSEALKHVKKILQEEKEMEQKKIKLKKSSPEKASVIDIAGFIVYLKDHYKFQINKVQHYAEGLFRSISNLTGYDEGLIRDMTPGEIHDLLLKNTINKEEIDKRIAYHAYIYNNHNEAQLVIGEEAKKFSQKYLATDEKQESFSGRIACKGRGVGKAKIILGTRDFHKMQEGDILVVMNTSPDFVPIMKKAAAIVAEEGGITGHVSVVSREFGIPSVVGIKQVTSIIQDGDLVEVDAENGVVKILEKTQNEEWIKNVTREVTIFPAASVTKSFGKISKPFEIDFDYEHILFVGNTWYYRKSDYEKLKDILIKKIQEDTNYVQHIAKKQKEVGESLKKFVQKLNSMKISNKNIASHLREYDEKMTEFYAFWWIAIPVGEILEMRVRKILENRSEIDFDELMFVREELELVREKRLRNEIAIQCQKYKKYEDLPRILEQKLIQHAEQFGWINTSYHVGVGLSARDFFEKIQAENPEESREEMLEQRKREKNTITKLKKHLSKEDQSIIESMQTIMYLRNYQKETVNECQYKSEIFLRKIAQEIELEWDTFLAFSSKEIKEFIEDKLPKKEYMQKAKKRQKEFVIEWVDVDVYVYEEGLEKYFKKVAKNEPEQTKTIQGSPAYKGKTSGTVRVIHKKSDIELFIPGEILVTNMTSIDYVHIMGRASAIITNEGGITCHAAIFSRELRIPCIIGTKNATEILKTGDFVEVDAEKGTITRQN